MTVTRLQWGHDLLIVEGQSGCIVVGGNSYASMGPRSVDRGRPPTTPSWKPSPASFNGATIC